VLPIETKRDCSTYGPAYLRLVPDRKDRSPYELITNVRHNETWFYTPSCWLVKNISVLKEDPVYFDGELYEH